VTGDDLSVRGYRSARFRLFVALEVLKTTPFELFMLRVERNASGGETLLTRAMEVDKPPGAHKQVHLVSIASKASKNKTSR
jgi:hypothetical protein